MALKPDLKDPHYETEMERFKTSPERWNKPPLVANVAPPVRPAGFKPAPLKQPEGREHSVERVRRNLLAHYGINPTDGGVADRSKPIAEALFAIAGEVEVKVNYATDSARNMLRSAGLL